MHRVALRIGALVSLLLLACAEKHAPPPRPPEVPLDDAPRPTPPSEAAESEPSNQEPSSPPSPISAVDGGPRPLLESAHAPPAGSSRKGKLTAAQCQALLDKFVDLFALSQGLTEDDLEKVRPMFRAALAGQSAYKGAQGACRRDQTQAQYDCAMAASTVESWKACLK